MGLDEYQPNPTIVAHPPPLLLRAWPSRIPFAKLGPLRELCVKAFAFALPALRPRMKKPVEAVHEPKPKRVLHRGRRARRRQAIRSSGILASAASLLGAYFFKRRRHVSLCFAGEFRRALRRPRRSRLTSAAHSFSSSLPGPERLSVVHLVRIASLKLCCRHRVLRPRAGPVLRVSPSRIAIALRPQNPASRPRSAGRVLRSILIQCSAAAPPPRAPMVMRRRIHPQAAVSSAPLLNNTAHGNNAHDRYTRIVLPVLLSLDSTDVGYVARFLPSSSFFYFKHFLRGQSAAPSAKPSHSGGSPPSATCDINVSSCHHAQSYRLSYRPTIPRQPKHRS